MEELIQTLHFTYRFTLCVEMTYGLAWQAHLLLEQYSVQQMAGGPASQLRTCNVFAS